MKFIRLVTLTLGFVVLYNLVFFNTRPGLGTGFLFLLLNIYFFLIRNKNNQNLNLAFLSSIIATLAAFLFSFRSNPIIQFLNLMMALMFSSVALFFYKYEHKFYLLVPNFLLTPFSLFIQTISSAFGLLETKNNEEKETNPLNAVIVRSTLIALVLTGILLWLLASGDLIFSKIINNFLANIWERLAVSAFIFFSLMIIGISKISKYFSLMEKEVSLSLGKIHELAIILSSIVCLFSLFILIQFRYLFLPVGETELRQIGINSATYSEYVRAGFTELLVAATIVFGVIVYATRYTHKFAAKQKLPIQFLSAILTFENGLILTSATKRVFLYISAHGLTRAREFGLVFLIWLSLLFILLLINIFNQINREFLAKTILGLSLIIILSTNFINLDGIIATKYPPTVNGEIDYHYLMTLSKDALESWAPATIDTEVLFTNLLNKTDLSADDYRKFTLAKISLYKFYNNHITYLKNKYDPIKKWQSFNISEYLAYQHLRDRNDIFSRVPGLLNQSNLIEQKFSTEAKREVRFDRGTAAPLIP